MAQGVLVALGVINPDEPEAMKTYSEGAPPILIAAGGKPIGRFRFREAIHGDQFPETVFAMQFEDTDTLMAAFESDAYKALIPHRDRAFSRLQLFVTEAL